MKLTRIAAALALLALYGCATFPHAPKQRATLVSAANDIIASTGATVLSSAPIRYGATYGATSGGSEVGSFPNAAQLGGSERILADQNGNTVNILPSQIAQYLGIPNGLVFPLSIANGGTGASTAMAGALNLLPTLIASDCLSNDGTSLLWAACGSGGGMTWPSAAGIPNYSGSSSWGTSYTTTGSGSIVVLSADPTLSSGLDLSFVTGSTSQCLHADTSGNVTGTGSNADCVTQQTASMPNLTAAGSLAAVGTIGTGVWQGSIIGTAYGGTGTSTPGLIAGTNITISGTWPNQTITASSTASTAFSALTGATNTSAAMLVGTGASLGPTGSGTINANQVNGATVPASANVLSTNSSGQVVPLTSALPLFTFATASAPSCQPGQIGFATDGNGALSWCNNEGQWVNNGGVSATLVGSNSCTATTVEMDSTGGSFILGSGCVPGTDTIKITFNGATGMTAAHLWTCTFLDYTLQQAGIWFGEWGESAYTMTTATMPIPLASSVGDEMHANCTPH